MRLREFIEVSEIDDSETSELNRLLQTELDRPFNSPENGILAVHKVLQYFNLDIQTPYETVAEGDEAIFELKDDLLIYLIYAPTDEGYYEFYAETGDEERMDELLSEDEEEEE